MESEGKKVRSGGGFGGTGFKFDEAEAQYTTEKKKYQKAAFGLQVIDPAQIQLGIHRISEPDNRSVFLQIRRISCIWNGRISSRIAYAAEYKRRKTPGYLSGRRSDCGKWISGPTFIMAGYPAISEAGAQCIFSLFVFFMSYRLLIKEVKKVWSLGFRLTSDYWIFKWFLFFFSGLWWRGCGGRDWCPDWAAAFSQAHCQKYWCRVSGQCYWWVDNFFWILLPHKIVPFSILSLQYAASQFSLRKIGISSKWNQVYKK